MAFFRATIRCSVPRKSGINILYNLHGTKSRIELINVQHKQIALKSTVSGALENSTENGQSYGSRRDPLDRGFADPKVAFKSKTTWEVLRAYIVYTLCSSNYVVEHNMQVRKSIDNAKLGYSY